MKRLLKAIFLIAWSVNAATVVDQNATTQKIPLIVTENSIDNINKIQPLFDKGTMVIFDIDEVLIRASKDIKKRFLVEGWDTQEVFSAAKEKAQSVICLTTRSSLGSDFTLNELAGKGVTFDNKFSDIFKYDPYSFVIFANSESVMYSRGVIFTSGTNKGLALAKFLEKFPKEKLPQRIVFIDDLKSNVDSVRKLFADDDFIFDNNPMIPEKEREQALMRIRSKIKEVHLFHYTRVESEKGSADKQ